MALYLALSKEGNKQTLIIDLDTEIDRLKTQDNSLQLRTCVSETAGGYNLMFAFLGNLLLSCRRWGGGGGKQTQLEQDCYYLYLERVETGTIPAEPASLVRQPLKSKIIEIYGYRKISSGVACTFTERVMWQLKIAKLAKR